MIILGIDPGFGITGYGLIEVQPPYVQNARLIEAGVLRSNTKKNFSERLSEIHSQLQELLEEFSPEAMTVEDIFSVGRFPRSSILIGHVRGVILLIAAQKTIPVYSYFPLQVKKALIGNGHATKSQVQKMVKDTLKLDQTPKPDDLSDALAIALCHASHIRN